MTVEEVMSWIRYEVSGIKCLQWDSVAELNDTIITGDGIARIKTHT
jgi:hypothetical protein